MIRTPQKRRCSAHSSRTGQRCRRWAIRGGTVCPSHGGSIERVKAAADERVLNDAAQSALDQILARLAR